jgi:acyl carrier protein
MKKQVNSIVYNVTGINVINPEYEIQLDSLDRIELLMELESAFDIDLDEKELRNWNTPENIYKSVAQAQMGG